MTTLNRLISIFVVVAVPMLETTLIGLLRFDDVQWHTKCGRYLPDRPGSAV